VPYDRRFAKDEVTILVPRWPMRWTPALHRACVDRGAFESLSANRGASFANGPAGKTGRAKIGQGQQEVMRHKHAMCGSEVFLLVEEWTSLSVDIGRKGRRYLLASRN